MDGTGDPRGWLRLSLARRATITLIVMSSVFVVPTHEVAGASPAARHGSFPIAIDAAGARASTSTARALPWRANLIGLSWRSADDHAEGVAASVRTHSADGWGPWTELAVEPDEGPDPGHEPGARPRVFTQPLWVGTIDDVEARVVTGTGAAPVRDVRVEAINTLGDADEVPALVGALRAVGRFLTARAVTGAEASPSQPRIVSRAGWEADESWRDNDGPGNASELRLAIVHHTAGQNSYSRAESPAIVRSIYAYHTKGLGYSDIEYNFLIDRYGTIYEGRAGGIDQPVIGAHAGGFNTYSTGIALMGDFTGPAPPKRMIDSLVRLLAWKFDVHHVPPTGRITMTAQRDGTKYDEGDRVRLHRIAAHRHTNATACPGTQTMPKFSSIRDRVDRRGHPKIYLPELSATAIRPSADGVDATVQLQASFSRHVRWTWRVVDAGGTTWYRTSGMGTRVNLTWHGARASGVPLLPGRYSWRLDGTRTKDGTTARAATGWIDVLGPTARGCTACVVTGPTADFDGDGASDLAVGVPGEDDGDVVDAGAVNVLYGKPGQGLTAAGDELLTASRLGIPGAPGDGLGSTLAAGDFDGDGFADLAIGAPRADVDRRANAGAVVIVRGSDAGLDLSSARVITQNSPGVAGGAEGGDGFGAALAAGDLDGDGRDDLAIGTPAEDGGAVRDVGMVTVLMGSAEGLEARAGNGWSQNTDDVPGAAEAWDAFGSSLAIGDLNDDGRDDLVVGVPGEGIGRARGAGSLHVFLGGASGPRTAGTQTWHQGVGATDTPEAGDGLGFALAIGDVDGDDRADVLVGVPGEETTTEVDAGAVVLLRGAADGILRTGERLLHRGLTPVTGEQGTGDGFGGSLTTGDFNGDGYADVAIGAPGDDIDDHDDAGSVTVLYGNDAGLLEVTGALWHLDSGGVIGAASRGDLFGWALHAGDFDGDGKHDLVVGIPGLDLPGAADAGGVTVLYGAAGGVSARDQRWHQNASGIRGVAQTADLFGSV